MSERIIEPTAERQRHGKVDRVSATIKDALGTVGLPFRGYDTLERMAAQKRISNSQLIAGQRFHDLFRRAGFDGLYSADPRRIPTSNAVNPMWGPVSNDTARLIVTDSLEALGGIHSPGGSCAWHILGCETSLKNWVAIFTWGHAVRLDVTTASGILIADLGILEIHYGLKKP